MNKITLAVLLAFAAAGRTFAAAPAVPPVPANDQGTASAFAGDLPEGFADAVFDTPLAVRIEVDGQYLADAMVVLGRNQHIQLTEMLQSADSAIALDVRQDYETLLRKGLKLGACSGFECPAGIVRSAFSIADSKLALFTGHGAASAAAQRYYSTPSKGTGGALLDHNLSLAATPGGTSTSANYNLSLTSNLGSWTAYSDLSFNYYRYARMEGHSGGEQSRKYLNDAYLQKEFHGYYLRGGLFAPDNSTDQGNLAPLPFSSADTIFGFSVGSSDTLLKRSNRPSMIPLTVSASKAGRVELYKDGRLIGTYATQPGINNLPTETLPDGIYNVDVRLFEDNRLVSSAQESIYKPSNWNGKDRWRYRFYGGRRLSVWDGGGYGMQDSRVHDNWVGGVQFGYLFTPKLHGGVTVMRDGIDVPVGLFADYEFNDNLRFYLNPYYSATRGYGFEVQGTLRAGSASLAFTHRYAERKYSRRLDPIGIDAAPVYTDISRYSSLTGSWQINQKNRVSASFSYDHVNSQHTIDVSYYRDMFSRGGTVLQGYISLYDRPYVWSGAGAGGRQRGVMIGLTGTFGRGSDQFNTSAGTGQTGNGVDRSLNLNYQHTYADSDLKSINVAGNYAKSGSSATASAQFANRAVTGDGYLQYGTASRDTTLGLNLQSTTAIGGGAVGQAAPSTGHAGSAVLLDLNSDAGLPDKGLLARLSGGESVTLHPGRNLIPIDPYQVEHLSFDLDDGSAGGVRFQPGATTVQLYPGAVAHQTVDAMRTVTVVGRIVGADGKAKTGIQIRNHAGQAWPENDGVFTLELSRRQPSIEVFDGDRKQCTFDLRDRLKAAGADGAVVLGDLKCE
jgi:hypothetical protein